MPVLFLLLPLSLDCPNERLRLRLTPRPTQNPLLPPTNSSFVTGRHLGGSHTENEESQTSCYGRGGRCSRGPARYLGFAGAWAIDYLDR